MHDLDKAFRRTPQAFSQGVAQHVQALSAGQVEEARQARPSRRPVGVIVAFAVLLLAVTAVAVVGQIGLLDTIYNDVPDKGAAKDVITTEIVQTGGDTAKTVALAVREAVYDGQMVHFLVAATPRQEGTMLVWDKALHEEYALSQAAPYGDTVYGLHYALSFLDIEMESPVHYGFQREEGGLVFITSYRLPEGVSPETLRVEASCGVLDAATEETIETAALSFDIPRTTTPISVVLTPRLDRQLVYIERLEMQYTPLEVTLTITAKPKLLAYSGLALVDESGRVSMGYYNLYEHDPETGMETVGYTWPTFAEMPEKLTLWIVESEEALVLNTATGELIIHPAQATYEEYNGFNHEKITVTVNEEEVLP